MTPTPSSPSAPLPPEVIHLGGKDTVTGSCHLLRINGLHILVDCGLVQGNDTAAPMESWPVKPSRVDFVILTHAHIDHMGRVPELVRRGFRGEILCSHPTRLLLQPMLRDALSFSDLEGKEAASLLETIDDLSWGFEYNEFFHLKKGVRFRLGRAGHILGSSFVKIEDGSGWSVIFSGDLGARDTPLLPDPDKADGCDLLVLESTYGDRLHEDRRERVKRLGEVLEHCLSDGGKVFIPAFSLGRTQELLYELDRLSLDRKLGIGTRIPVCIDSPLGIEVTRIYAQSREYWDREAKEILRRGDDPLNFEALYGVLRFRDHLELLHMDGPAVIIAGSGMCTGGRIVNHLKGGLGDGRNDVLFVGYQAAGTPGRDLLRYGRQPGGYVELEGERFPIKAQVHVLGGYSAHADQAGLVEWARNMDGRPEIRLVHGEERAREGLRRALTANG